MSLTTIKPCDCKHAYQDKKYGYGLRIHNYADKKNEWRCTVCGKMKAKGGTEKPLTRH